MKTNYINRFFIAIACGLLMTSCDSFLDTRPDDLRSPDQIYSTYNSSFNAMMGIYSYIRWYNPASQPEVTSSLEIDVAYAATTKLGSGTWSASSPHYDQWNNYYRAIREANYFLKNIDLCPASQLGDFERAQWKAEVRCVRAYFYALLMRLYGPVILVGDEVFDSSITDPRARNSWDECVAYIVGEFDDLADDFNLPLIQKSNNYGRMSQAIALAYKARILQQSASPQFNGNPMYANVKNADGKNLFPTAYDENKWRLAKQAMKDVIDLNLYEVVKVEGDNGIDPYKSYKSVFTVNQNKEIIFSRLSDDAHYDRRVIPSVYHQSDAWGGGYNPTQDIVDSYAMASGVYPITGYKGGNKAQPVIDTNSGYSEEGFTNFTHPIEGVERNTFNMYVNREPRFYVSIFYGGLSWFVPNDVSKRKYVEMFAGGNSSFSHNKSTTGYNMVKLASPDFVMDPWSVAKTEIMCMRYPEILLNYVEASIELKELSDPNILTYWNEIRLRAGVDKIEEVYPDMIGDQAKMRDLLRKERRVEFAFEGQSFFDNRRWLVGVDVEAGDTYGMNIAARGNTGTQSYPEGYFKRTRIDTRVFTESYYLYPIPQGAINKNSKLVQNYKW